MTLHSPEPAPAQPSAPLALAHPVGADAAVSAGVPTGISAQAPQGTPPPQSLKLAGLAAFFGLTQRRRTASTHAVPHDDPYAAYLRWSGGSVSTLNDRESPAA